MRVAVAGRTVTCCTGQVDRVKELLSTHTGALARSAGMNYTPKQLQERWEKVHIASRVTEYVGVRGLCSP